MQLTSFQRGGRRNTRIFDQATLFFRLERKILITRQWFFFLSFFLNLSSKHSPRLLISFTNAQAQKYSKNEFTTAWIHK